MKRLTPALLFAVSLCGQTQTGTWQGTLVAPGTPKGGLRIVVKIDVVEKGFTAEFYNIDQPTPVVRADSVMLSGSVLKMSFASLGATYEGKLEADGRSIVGAWTRGAPAPFTLVKATRETAWAIPEPTPPPQMMPAAADPGIEVATIKPSRAEERLTLATNPNGIVNSTATSVADLIKFAYGVHPRQIVGGPSWVQAERFDVTIKPDIPGMPSVNQTGSLRRKLLAERFQLAFHREKQELAAYTISVAKDGPKIAKEINDKTPIPAFGGTPQGGFGVRNATIADFAGILQAIFLEQPVVDQTGFGDQRYSFVLKWTPDRAPRQTGGAEVTSPPRVVEDDAPPDLFTAVQQQLGLRMQSGKALVDVLVIDKVERPSAN